MRGLIEAVSQPDYEVSSGYDARLLPRFGWSCECGGHSRVPGFLSEHDAENAAQQHRVRKGISHPHPTIHDEDAPGLD
jgi:hypothetical protein